MCPLLKPVRRQVKAKDKTFEAEVYGVTATFSTHHYRAWSFEQVQRRYAALSDDNKNFVDNILIANKVQPALTADGIYHSDLCSMALPRQL